MYMYVTFTFMKLYVDDFEYYKVIISCVRELSFPRKRNKLRDLRSLPIISV